MWVLNENGNEAAAKAAKAKVAQFVTESITSKTSTWSSGINLAGYGNNLTDIPTSIAQWIRLHLPSSVIQSSNPKHIIYVFSFISSQTFLLNLSLCWENKENKQIEDGFGLFKKTDIPTPSTSYWRLIQNKNRAKQRVGISPPLLGQVWTSRGVAKRLNLKKVF